MASIRQANNKYPWNEPVIKIKLTTIIYVHMEYMYIIILTTWFYGRVSTWFHDREIGSRLSRLTGPKSWPATCLCTAAITQSSRLLPAWICYDVDSYGGWRWAGVSRDSQSLFTLNEKRWSHDIFDLWFLISSNNTLWSLYTQNHLAMEDDLAAIFIDWRDVKGTVSPD